MTSILSQAEELEFREKELEARVEERFGLRAKELETRIEELFGFRIRELEERFAEQEQLNSMLQNQINNKELDQQVFLEKKIPRRYIR